MSRVVRTKGRVAAGRLTGFLRSISRSLKNAGGKRYQAAFGITIVTIACLAFLLSLVNFLYAQAAHSDLFSDRPYTIEIAPSAAADIKPLVDTYLKAHPGTTIKMTGDDHADVIISRTPVKGYDAVQVEGMPALRLTAGSLVKTFRNSRMYWFSYKRTGILFKVQSADITGLEDYLLGYWDGAKDISLNAGGDVIPARHVAQQMAKHGVSWPFKEIAPVSRDADIVYADLECPLTNRYPAPYSGMVFSAPAKTINGVEMLGVDVVTLANNHTTNFGADALTDTIKLLKQHGIKYAGGGSNYAEAHRPAIVETNGFKFAFLSYNGIKGSIDATSDSPGVSWIGIEPWYPDNPADWQTVASDIREAKKQADFVVTAFHWSKEYEYHPNPSMVILAHQACDAGADMVIGQHPHSIQSFENYNGKLIAYSLGNFIFDQRFSEQVRQGVVLKCKFKNNVPVSFDLVPYRVNDACQTIPVNGTVAKKLYTKIFQISGWK